MPQQVTATVQVLSPCTFESVGPFGAVHLTRQSAAEGRCLQASAGQCADASFLRRQPPCCRPTGPPGPSVTTSHSDLAGQVSRVRPTKRFLNVDKENI